jgi:hypothetical protein
LKKSDKPAKRIPKEEELIRAIPLVYSRLHRGFTLYIWISRVHPMLRDHPDYENRRLELVSIKSACVESTLMSIRDLGDFFRPRTGKEHESDLRAEDYFGFKSMGDFLSKEERDSINQHIAHLTYQPVWQQPGEVNTLNPKEFDAAALLEKAARAVFGFFAYLEGKLAADHPEVVAGIKTAKAAMERGLAEVNVLATLEREFFS